MLANWNRIAGGVDDEGRMTDAFEITQPREMRIIGKTMEDKALPSLAWTGDQPLRDAVF